MVTTIYKTADGHTFPTRAQAAKYEALTALELHIGEMCATHEDCDGLHETGHVSTYIVNYLNEITRLVNEYRSAKSVPNYSKEDVEDWVFLKLWRGDEFVGTPNSGYVRGIVNRVWVYLTSEGQSTSEYSELETELAERAWDHFEGS